MKYKKTSVELRNLVGVEPITTVIRCGRLRWYVVVVVCHGQVRRQVS